MAKLAVLTVVPKRCTTHWPLSGGGRTSLMRALGKAAEFRGGGRCFLLLDPHGVTPSDRSTPLSRASCSSVIGMNDPEEQRNVSCYSREQGATVMHTNPTNNKDLGSPAIAIPSEQFLLTGQARVFTRVLGRAGVSWSFGIALHIGVVRGRAFIVSFEGRGRR